MLNLKNTLFTIVLTMGTIALAHQDFTPKLIIKNISSSRLELYASDNLITQLKLENSPLLHTQTHILPSKIHGIEHRIIEVNSIVLEPNETLVSNSVNICLRGVYTLFLSPRTYADYCRHDEIRSMFDSTTRCVKPIISREMQEKAIDLKHDEISSMFDSTTRRVKPIISREIQDKAIDLKKDIMIHLDIMLMKKNPPIPYLEIKNPELIDRT